MTYQIHLSSYFYVPLDDTFKEGQYNGWNVDVYVDYGKVSGRKYDFDYLMYGSTDIDYKNIKVTKLS